MVESGDYGGDVLRVMEEVMNGRDIVKDVICECLDLK